MPSATPALLQFHHIRILVPCRAVQASEAVRDLQERRGNALRQALAIVHSALRQADADARRVTGLLKQGVLVASPHADQQRWDEEVGICALSEWPLALEPQEIGLARDAALSAELVAELSACLRTGRGGREWISCGDSAARNASR